MKAKQEDYLLRVLAEGRILAKREKQPADWCSQKCVACLAAEARNIVDEKMHEYGFNSDDDVLMLEAKDMLATELNWGEEKLDLPRLARDTNETS